MNFKLQSWFYILMKFFFLHMPLEKVNYIPKQSESEVKNKTSSFRSVNLEMLDHFFGITWRVKTDCWASGPELQ